MASGRDELDVCLVVPPFDSLRFPPLGSAIVAAAVRARGLGVETVYGSILLGARIGYRPYMAVCTKATDQMVGERLFRPHAYPPDVFADLPPCAPLSPEALSIHDPLVDAIGPFLDELVERVLALNPKIVGVSSTFQQNLASAAVARRIKEAAPQICVVMGGANVSSPMGYGLAQAFPWVDHFFSGEADLAFPDFCELYVRTGERPAARVVECPPVLDMRQAPAPDFADYFAALREAQGRGVLPAYLPRFLYLESSRGCWWGAKHHCTFCGLNGETMHFRSKPASTVLGELDALSQAWGRQHIYFADNIMPLGYLKDLFPALAQRPTRPTLFYETKSNLHDDQLDKMVSAGITGIQPGIESFSSRVLRIMRKGVSGLQNLALLRSCRSIGMDVTWNYLFGFPGEACEDYEPVLGFLPALEHLQPPMNCEPLIIDRFSPYQQTPESFGLDPIEPYEAYAGLYPAQAPLADIAYHFRSAYRTPFLADESLRGRFEAAVRQWQDAWAPGRTPPILKLLDTEAEHVIVADTRRIAGRRMNVISRKMAAALKQFERPQPTDRLPDALAEAAGYLLERNFLIAHEGRLLSVVTWPRAVARFTEAAGRAELVAQRADAVPGGMHA